MWQIWFEVLVQQNSNQIRFTHATKEHCVSWIYKTAKKLDTNVIMNSWNFFNNYKHDEPNENRGEISVDCEDNNSSYDDHYDNEG